MTAPHVQKSACIAGGIWTLDDEAADIARQVEITLSGGIWVGDGPAPFFLGHLDADGQRAFVAHLKAGRLRAAIGMIADGAFRCGVRDAPALLASGRAQIVNSAKGPAKVIFMPQRVPAEIGVILSYADDAKVPRAELSRALRKGGNVRLGRMTSTVSMKALSKRDVDAFLATYPHRSKAGGSHRQR